MKVLFLDVDGVLNRDGTKEHVIEGLNRFVGLDKELVGRFLLWRNKHKDVDVVLSSTWRKYEGFRRALREHGIEWISETPDFVLQNRGKEILHWVAQNLNMKDEYAALDDQHIVGLGHRWVQTSEKHGLQNKHLRRVSQILRV